MPGEFNVLFELTKSMSNELKGMSKWEGKYQFSTPDPELFTDQKIVESDPIIQ
jgi:hypothetical protein